MRIVKEIDSDDFDDFDDFDDWLDCGIIYQPNLTALDKSTNLLIPSDTKSQKIKKYEIIHDYAKKSDKYSVNTRVDELINQHLGLPPSVNLMRSAVMIKDTDIIDNTEKKECKFDYEGATNDVLGGKLFDDLGHDFKLSGITDVKDIIKSASKGPAITASIATTVIENVLQNGVDIYKQNSCSNSNAQTQPSKVNGKLDMDMDMDMDCKLDLSNVIPNANKNLITGVVAPGIVATVAPITAPMSAASIFASTGVAAVIDIKDAIMDKLECQKKKDREYLDRVFTVRSKYPDSYWEDLSSAGHIVKEEGLDAFREVDDMYNHKHLMDRYYLERKNPQLSKEYVDLKTGMPYPDPSLPTIAQSVQPQQTVQTQSQTPVSQPSKPPVQLSYGGPSFVAPPQPSFNVMFQNSRIQNPSYPTPSFQPFQPPAPSVPKFNHSLSFTKYNFPKFGF